MSRVVEVGDYGVSETSDVWDHYLVAFYYVMATMTTNGVVGELTPATYSEVVFCSILMVVNMTLFAYILGEISTLIMKNDDKVRYSHVHKRVAIRCILACPTSRQTRTV